MSSFELNLKRSPTRKNVFDEIQFPENQIFCTYIVFQRRPACLTSFCSFSSIPRDLLHTEAAWETCPWPWPWRPCCCSLPCPSWDCRTSGWLLLRVHVPLRIWNSSDTARPNPFEEWNHKDTDCQLMRRTRIWAAAAVADSCGGGHSRRRCRQRSNDAFYSDMHAHTHSSNATRNIFSFLSHLSFFAFLFILLLRLSR